MNETLPDIKINTQFNRNSKYVAYAFLALLIGLIQVLEDVADNDITRERIWYEFIIIVCVLIILFPLLGGVFHRNWKWWQKTEILAPWKYSDVLFIFLSLVIYPLILLSLAYNTFFIDDREDIWVVWVASLLFVSIVIAIEVFWVMLKKSQKLESLNERLLRNEEMTKYQALMNQLNPHFLFNSLNVLSYLVHEDSNTSERFIEELSKIYRYILQLNETYLVPLKKEMEFIESYIFLQKIRYQDNLVFNAEISLAAYQKLLPPLSLEVLIENAIKHNVIDAQHPLRIRLHIQNNYLLVENNIQPRNEDEIESTQVGLKNLLEKYQILESEVPEFATRNGLFIAKIPLLNSEL
ncbi:MAG: histidine kinase [Chitinophagales bacterium]|nr:histidine kinase [Chitinophagales bacterium]